MKLEFQDEGFNDTRKSKTVERAKLKGGPGTDLGPYGNAILKGLCHLFLVSSFTKLLDILGSKGTQI